MAASSLPYGPVEFIPECEILYENGPGSDELSQGCHINPGHTRFIPVSEFRREHLPPSWHTEDVMESIQHHCDLTVKVIGLRTSPDRPDTYPDSECPYPYSHLKNKSGLVLKCGTGEMVAVLPSEPVEGEPCPCGVCKYSDEPKTKFWKILVATSTHVIYDQVEAEKSVFELFYDSDDRQGVEKLYAIKMLLPSNEKVRTYTDKCVVESVTHDLDLGARLKKLFDIKPENEIKSRFGHAKLESFIRNQYGVMVSHPHGMSKRITVGNILFFTVPTGPKIPTGTPHRLDKDLVCRLPLYPWSRHGDGDVAHQRGADLDIGTDDDVVASSSESESRNERQPNSDLDFESKVGTEFVIPKGLTFTLPPEATYAYRYNFDARDTCWLRFTPGTVFTSGAGKILPFPQEAEFTVPDEEDFEELFILGKYYYISYDIPSCPGSSGSTIKRNPKERIYHPIQHSGALQSGPKLSGLNISIPRTQISSTPENTPSRCS